MQITFNLPHVFNSSSDAEDNAHALKALLDCMVQLNVAYLRANPMTPGLYQSGVRYGRTQIWDTIPALYSRRFGDCKSLATALVAEMLVKGKRAWPVFRWMPKANGVRDFHILVRTPKEFLDPSKVLGMGKNENAYFQTGTRP